ncbi:hypothetical protein LTS08_006879 [Lithohypha guttulata]|uniref:uncharacterized protein n=1 Tax=Lithohypha guttulata TaxID=1690604 RepID=UPI002DE196FE|nr:hypothetical protein LTR51_001933 [Lithohypha guttulata]KAK5097467.1 hypothetical protein LTS08_006879 [Lithohypha guttulata]
MITDVMSRLKTLVQEKQRVPMTYEKFTILAAKIKFKADVSDEDKRDFILFWELIAFNVGEAHSHRRMMKNFNEEV